MLYIMKRLIINVIIMFFATTALAADVELLHANEWMRPKSATTLMEMPAVSKSMRKLQKDTDSTLSIKYPGGDEGTLWANELRSWLIALGLSSRRIELVPGSAISTTIEFEVLSTDSNRKKISFTDD